MQKTLKFTSYMSFLVNGMLAVMTGTIIKYLVSDYGISNAAAGRMVAAQSIGNMVMVLLSGFIIQAIGRRAVLYIFPLMFTIGFGGVSFISNEYVLYVLFAITGFGWGICNNILNIIMMEENNGDISVLHASYAVGSFLGPFFVMAITGWGLSWKVAVIFVAVAAVFLVPGYMKSNIKTAPKGEKEPITRKDFDFFKKPRYYTSLLMYFGYIGCEVAINSWIITYLTDMGLMTQKRAELMLSIFWVIVIFIRWSVGKFLNRIPRRLLLLIQWCGLAIGMTVLLNCEKSGVAIAMMVVMAIFLGAITQVNAQNANEFIVGKGISSGILFATGCLGSTVLPMIVGSFADTKGIFYGMCIVCGVLYLMILVGIVNYYLVGKEQK